MDQASLFYERMHLHPFGHDVCVCKMRLCLVDARRRWKSADDQGVNLRHLPLISCAHSHCDTLRMRRYTKCKQEMSQGICFDDVTQNRNGRRQEEEHDDDDHKSEKGARRCGLVLPVRISIYQILITIIIVVIVDRLGRFFEPLTFSIQGHSEKWQQIFSRHWSDDWFNQGKKFVLLSSQKFFRGQQSDVIKPKM